MIGQVPRTCQELGIGSGRASWEHVVRFFMEADDLRLVNFIMIMNNIRHINLIFYVYTHCWERFEPKVIHPGAFEVVVSRHILYAQEDMCISSDIQVSP